MRLVTHDQGTFDPCILESRVPAGIFKEIEKSHKQK